MKNKINLRIRIGRWIMMEALRIQGFPPGEYSVAAVPASEGEFVIVTARQARSVPDQTLINTIRELERSGKGAIIKKAEDSQ